MPVATMSLPAAILETVAAAADRAVEMATMAAVRVDQEVTQVTKAVEVMVLNINMTIITVTAGR